MTERPSRISTQKKRRNEKRRSFTGGGESFGLHGEQASYDVRGGVVIEEWVGGNTYKSRRTDIWEKGRNFSFSWKE